MVEAARRVAASDLRAMVRHRQQRESTALAEMQAKLARAAAAETRLADARTGLEAREADRTRGERAVYDRLGEGEPLTPPQLQEQLGALSRLSEAVEEAEGDLARAQSQLIEALEAVAEARENYARHARDAAKWVRIEEAASDGRRRDLEEREELELEDDVSLRHGSQGGEA